jgi:hypothetical protein
MEEWSREWALDQSRISPFLQYSIPVLDLTPKTVLPKAPQPLLGAILGP